MNKFKGFNNIFTADWNSGSFAPDLEDNKISAVLSITKTKMPKMSLDIFTVINIQHYTSTLTDLKDNVLDENLINIARIIHHFVSNDHRILIRSNEDGGAPMCYIFYFIWSYYHNADGTRKEKITKPEISIAAQTIQALKKFHISCDIDGNMMKKLYDCEKKYAEAFKS